MCVKGFLQPILDQILFGFVLLSHDSFCLATGIAAYCQFL